ncbi:phosphatidate cytidylyltransferase [Candidatus Peregrinibacteria bacterium]|nr:phosphatidate cytidylyltransferase [Candidatus Peregrinibacteria bacterium]
MTGKAAKPKKSREYKKALRKEILRKMIHLLELPVLLAYTLLMVFYGQRLGLLALTALLVILLEIEYIRLEYRLRLPAVIDILRRHEKDNVASSIFFVAATIICFAAFDYEIALLALMMTVFGDLMSALIGIRFGKHKIYKKKTLEGFTAGLVTNSLVGVILMPQMWVLFLPMAVIASLTELWTGKLDDNLTVPLAASFTGQILLFLMQMQITGFPGPFLETLIHWF